jgi:tight adherence protein C
LLAFGIGLLRTLVMMASGLQRRWLDALSSLAGDMAGFSSMVITLAPWLILVMFSSVPWLHVRARRRRRVEEIERDLPITLELLATLSEAGLGLDAAIVRLLESASRDQPLLEEFRAFQQGVRSGMTRVNCYRRLARRVDVAGVTTVVSALVQSEQIGAGLSGTLRRQADDLRNRRRERGLTFAQALPVKLVFPLVICFLPGIFAITLGPAFYQFFQLADQVALRH